MAPSSVFVSCCLCYAFVADAVVAVALLPVARGLALNNHNVHVIRNSKEVSGCLLSLRSFFSWSLCLFIG